MYFYLILYFFGHNFFQNLFLKSYVHWSANVAMRSIYTYYNTYSSYTMYIPSTLAYIPAVTWSVPWVGYKGRAAGVDCIYEKNYFKFLFF
jgi:hypothetical protein